MQFLVKKKAKCQDFKNKLNEWVMDEGKQGLSISAKIMFEAKSIACDNNLEDCIAPCTMMLSDYETQKPSCENQTKICLKTDLEVKICVFHKFNISKALIVVDE